jgi:glycosyltransferase involved in cell wall biosynthesis
MKKLIIIQTVSPSYRNKFFTYISNVLKDKFELYSGDSYFECSVKSDLSFSNRKKITNIFILGRKLLFQFGMWTIIFSDNLIVIEMNPRIISNWIILFVRKILNRKTILWGHAWPRKGMNSKSDKLRNYMRSLGDEIIVYTKTQQVELKKKMPNKNINAACNSLYLTNEMTTNKSDQIIQNIIYVGRLTESKKGLFLLKTFHSIIEKLPKDTNLLIIGEGPEKLKMEEYVAKNNLNIRVRMYGHVDNYKILKGLYSSSLLSVSPGYVGLSITQSFGFGVPMIVSRDENHSPEIEAVHENENAVFFKTDDMKNFDKQILNFYKNKEYWLNQRTSIVEGCKKQYSIEAMGSTFIKIFDKYTIR